MKIYQVADEDAHKHTLREIWWEYLQWANREFQTHFDITFDIETILRNDMLTLGKFMPPQGRLLLTEVDGEVLGCACLKHLSGSIGEIKRMYVRPVARGKGVGRALLDALIKEASTSGYELLRLDSAKFMTEAHYLYRTQGFALIEPYEGSEGLELIEAYEGSETSSELRRSWLFMERRLDTDA